MKIMIAEFMHETNTLIAQRTSLQDFKNYEFLYGDDIFGHFRNVKNEMGGFLEVLEEEQDLTVIPAVAAQATPGGIVSQEVYDLTAQALKSTLEAHPDIDGVLFAMHGAMVTEAFEDGEGEMLEYLRSIIGPDIPVFVTLDLHANITRKMLTHATALFPCDNYPHTDSYDKGLLAAQLMLRTLRKEIKPVMRWQKLNMIFPIMPTSFPVMKELSDYCRQERQREGILSASIVHGFLCADIRDLGASVLAISDSSAEKAQKLADDLAGALWEKRHELKRRCFDLDEALSAVQSASDPGFFVFADITDNPGGGAAGDSTHMLRQLLERHVENVAVASIFDPETVAAAQKSGVGTTFSCSLGGKSAPEIVGEPINAPAYVKSLSDGTIIYKGQMDHGAKMTTGLTAVLVIQGIEVIVTSKRLQPRDIEIFRANGIEPRDKRIVVTKSSVHYRACYEQEALGCFDIEEPGVMPQTPGQITYEHVHRPVYPLEADADMIPPVF